MERFGEAAAGDGLVGTRAELDVPHVFHGRFANVPEQREVSKQITMKETAHPSPPSWSWLVLRHLPCLRVEGGQESPDPCEKPSHATTSWESVWERERECLCVCIGCQCSAPPCHRIQLVQELDEGSPASPYRLGG